VDLKNINQNWPINIKSLAGILGCLLGLGIVYFGFGIGTETPKKEATAGASATAQKDLKRPVRSMNLALGNMVFFAQDLGFRVTSVKNGAVDTNKIAARIESQLQGVRELYRSEIIKNPDLAGSMTLQFNITPSGEVSQVKESSSRLNDAEFKKAVIAETSKWSFSELVSEDLNVTCPLLFVHQGMDITSLVQWEKITGDGGEKPALAKVTSNSSRQSIPSQTSLAGALKSKPVTAPPTAAQADPDGKVFQIKYATSLRKEPNFTSPSLATFTIGTKVFVLQKQGDWLEVQSTNNGPVGFIRKEFVTLVEIANN
jgi:hypothetical protein